MQEGILLIVVIVLASRYSFVPLHKHLAFLRAAIFTPILFLQDLSRGTIKFEIGVKNLAEW